MTDTAAGRGSIAYEPCPQDGHSHDWRDCPTPEDWATTTAAIVARQDCPYCGAPPGERCGTGCRHQYRQEAGQVKNDGADYLRAFWAAQGAPTDG